MTESREFFVQTMADQDKIYPKPIRTSLAHKFYSLVKVAVVIYGGIFIFLFAGDFWFSADLFVASFFLAPAILLLSHLFLVFQESPEGCRFFSPIFFEHPVIPYRTWLEICVSDNEERKDKFVEAEGFLVGNQLVPFSCIDVIELSFWGNLIFKSSTVAGPIYVNGKKWQGQILFKLPASAPAPLDQRKFFQFISQNKPEIALNKRLSNLIERQKKLGKENKLGLGLLKIEEYVPLIGATVFIFIFLDFAISTCLYLDIHKHFFQAQYKARHKDETLAKIEYEKGESMRTGATGFMVTPVKSALFFTGAAASRLYQARAEALYHLGRRTEALQSLEKAIEYLPTNYKINLEMARWLSACGENKKARAYISSALESNSDSMLAKILILNDLYADKKKDKAERMERLYLNNLDDELFGDEPVWPPGGNRVVKEGWIKDDIEYLLKELKKGYFAQ